MALLPPTLLQLPGCQSSKYANILLGGPGCSKDIVLQTEFNVQRNEFLFIMQYAVYTNVFWDFCTCYGNKIAIKTHKILNQCMSWRHCSCKMRDRMVAAVWIYTCENHTSFYSWLRRWNYLNRSLKYKTKLPFFTVRQRWQVSKQLDFRAVPEKRWSCCCTLDRQTQPRQHFP